MVIGEPLKGTPGQPALSEPIKFNGGFCQESSPDPFQCPLCARFIKAYTILRSMQVPTNNAGQKLLTDSLDEVLGTRSAFRALAAGEMLVGCGASGGSGQGAISGVRLNHGGSSHTGGLE